QTGDGGRQTRDGGRQTGDGGRLTGDGGRLTGNDLWAQRRRPLRDSQTSNQQPLKRYLRNTIIQRIRPALVRNERAPAGAQRILIVGIRPELPVELVVACQLVAIERHAEPR